MKIARDLIGSLSGVGGNLLDKLASGNIFRNFVTNSNSSTNQDITINATFPDVQSSQEIEKAFNNLVNAATQRAQKNRRAY